jgi:hypothetical protein
MRVIQKPKTTTAQSLGEGLYSVAIEPTVFDGADTKSRRESPDTWINVEEVGTVRIDFRIDVEARNWGIKGISVSIPPAQISLTIGVLKNNGANDIISEQTIQFDPSQIELQMRPGNVVTISDLELALNKDFSVDYSKSYFEGTTLLSR